MPPIRRVKFQRNSHPIRNAVSPYGIRNKSKQKKKQKKGQPQSGIEGKARYAITEVKINRPKLPQPQAAEAGVIPTHPFRMYVVGGSGSGKSNFVVSLLSRAEFYKGYFDSVMVCSGTPLHLDPIYKKMNLDKKNFFPPTSEVIETVLELQEKHIEDIGFEHSRKILIILDDIIAYPQFARSQGLIDLFIKGRKWNISVILLSQAYHRVHKTVRLQMTCIVYFKGSSKEHEVLTEDYNAPGVTKKEFLRWIDYATHDKYNFFYVDINTPIDGPRYRKNLTEPINTNSLALKHSKSVQYTSSPPTNKQAKEEAEEVVERY